MAAAETLAGVVEWAFASESLAGELVSGDRHLVQPYGRGVLLGVVDGLGHGPEAAASANRVIRILAESAQQPLVSLIQRCHHALQGSRGAVASLARLEDGRMTWIGVGNVRGILVRLDPSRGLGREEIVLRSGVLGVDLPALRVSVLPVFPGDAVVFATDGLGEDFPRGIDVQRPLQPLVDHLLRRYRTGNDDALVLAARCLKGDQ